MKIKTSEISDYVDGLNMSKTDKVFIKSALKKMSDDMNKNYEDAYKKAEAIFSKAQKKYNEDLEIAKEKAISSCVEKIVDMFKMQSINSSTHESNADKF